MLPFITNFGVNLASPCEGKQCGDGCDFPGGSMGYCGDDNQCKPEWSVTCPSPGDMIYSFN